MPAPSPGLHRNNAAEWAMTAAVWPLRYVVLAYDAVRRFDLRFWICDLRLNVGKRTPAVIFNRKSQIENRKSQIRSPIPGAPTV